MQNVDQTIMSQFANSPTIVALIEDLNNVIDPTVNIDSWYENVWNIETAQGFGLDFWGIVVGVSRNLQVTTGTYFGFEGPVGASGTEFNQAIFYNGETVTTNFPLPDSQYRTLILAKAAFNITNGSIPAINAILNMLFGPNGLSPVVGNCYCTDGATGNASAATNHMTMTYTFGSALSNIQEAIVTQSGVLPRPCGVNYSIVQP